MNNSAHLCHLFSVGLRVEWSFGQQDWMFLWGNSELVVEGVMPDLLHIVPVCDDTVFDRVLQGEDTTLALGLVTYVAVFLAHADHDSLKKKLTSFSKFINAMRGGGVKDNHGHTRVADGVAKLQIQNRGIKSVLRLLGVQGSTPPHEHHLSPQHPNQTKLWASATPFHICDNLSTTEDNGCNSAILKNCKVENCKDLVSGGYLNKFKIE